MQIVPYNPRSRRRKKASIIPEARWNEFRDEIAGLFRAGYTGTEIHQRLIDQHNFRPSRRQFYDKIRDWNNNRTKSAGLNTILRIDAAGPVKSGQLDWSKAAKVLTGSAIWDQVPGWLDLDVVEALWHHAFEMPGFRCEGKQAPFTEEHFLIHGVELSYIWQPTLVLNTALRRWLQTLDQSCSITEATYIRMNEPGTIHRSINDTSFRCINSHCRHLFATSVLTQYDRLVKLMRQLLHSPMPSQPIFLLMGLIFAYSLASLDILLNRSTATLTVERQALGEFGHTIHIKAMRIFLMSMDVCHGPTHQSCNWIDVANTFSTAETGVYSLYENYGYDIHGEPIINQDCIVC